ncbi:Structural maintenance of chromosomes protein 2 [Golovinomyces cichoracearum]|uniref:Structural maintenance of chromosomes protein n=1 Tax=Golovinomyces cichoracearum TaxID=62708 RepID=A0A420ISD0_9PEZI|nr:Structural maintenance of chromosomes protein 2 [Golovinomyces cichoracearum]
MRITEVIIDGFKSYAVRTVISGWDESFNSITGLNGSGKSNILDSICFVLGITNMTTVRAQNLQDLIYKRGQAGVTKASVTIVFDNREKKKSPIGFEDYAQISVTRQVMLGGTSKYLINGHRAQQQTIQNLFQSVQLNINNPNFLIMQGRITKVLNMKAVEILAMIEEAAGTRMFEERRDRAFKTMAKKEMKVQEITELLRDEIDPKLEKLRTEKRAFLDFQQTQNDLERLTRLVVAHDYIQTTEKLTQSNVDLELANQRMQNLEADSTKLRGEIECLTEDMKKVKLQRDKEVKKGSKAQVLEEEVKKLSHELVRLSTVIELKRSSIAEEKERKIITQKSIGEFELLIGQKKEIYQELQVQYDHANEELKERNEEAEIKEELLMALQTGVASKEGQESGYQGQLQDARNRANAASTEQEKLKLKITHLEKRIREESPRVMKAKEKNKDLLNGLQSLQVEAQTLDDSLKKLGFIPGEEDDMYRKESEHRQEIRELQEQIDELKRKVTNIDFNYDEPSPNFDRSKVKGLVAQLFTLDKRRHDSGTALEICAGARLYNVVVDNETTGTQLLQNGKLRKRITIIPLNKITAFKAPSEKVEAAHKLCEGKADLALSLIGYDQEVSAAMDYVFGNTLVCADADTAKKVTFDPNIRMKSVTLEGDSYDPSGTLSGGSSASSSGVLVTLQKLNELNKILREKEDSLRDLQAMTASKKQKLDQIRRIKQNLDLKTHEIKLYEERISNNSSSSIIQEVENMKLNVSQLGNDMNEVKKRQDQAQIDIKKIEKEMIDFNCNKDGKLVELKTSLDCLRKSLVLSSSNLKSLQKSLQEARLDSEQVGSELLAAQEQCHDIDQSLQTQDKEIEIFISEMAQVQKTHEIAEKKLAEEHAKLIGFHEELNSLEQLSRSKSAKITEQGLEIQKIGHLVEKLSKEIQAASQNTKKLEREHEWIAGDKNNFGQVGTLYDFNGQNISECKASLQNLTERFHRMKKKINPKVMNMIDSVEKKEVVLKNMMKTVIRDKKKIEETIVTLDEYKKKALLETWTKVNKDFGQIFAELLPGSFAKLDPPEGKTINEGLEVKVSLGNVWKESLTEFSGGQRSLIALSLIMALLQFKPAPMYILDEVDAALDLSHTQNIGRLINSRFKGSQFIVVSLKDGMFQNANRIFRTRFSEGTSVVQALTPADFK